jgi:hypothetical protein
VNLDAKSSVMEEQRIANHGCFCSDNRHKHEKKESFRFLQNKCNEVATVLMHRTKTHKLKYQHVGVGPLNDVSIERCLGLVLNPVLLYISVSRYSSSVGDGISEPLVRMVSEYCVFLTFEATVLMAWSRRIIPALLAFLRWRFCYRCSVVSTLLQVVPFVVLDTLSLELVQDTSRVSMDAALMWG